MPQHDLPRREDARLLTGAGRFLADCLTPDTCFAGFLRSDVGFGRVVCVDIGAALTLSGVRAVLTATDLDDDGIAPLRQPPLPRDDGGDALQIDQPILAGERVRHIGEPLALVVADSPGALAEAMEAIVVEIKQEAPATGTAFCRRFGDDAAAVDRALGGAAHLARVDLTMPRMTTMALEPRGVIAQGADPARLTLRASTQSPFALRDQIAAHFGWPKSEVRVLAGDVGGSFGLKGYMAAEDAALAWAARRLGLDLAWVPSRSETMLADAQGRSARAQVTVGLGADHSILALRVDFDVDVGAYPGPRAMGIAGNINGVTGMYHVPCVFAQVTGHLSPRPPIAPFRGNGRPETTLAIEAVLDRAARDLRIDPVDLRRRNLIGAGALPVTTRLGVTLDSGDFARVMARAQSLNMGAEDRRARAQAQGLLYGIGLANCIEAAGGPVTTPRPDFARLTVTGTGQVVLAPGVMSVGQGHETGLPAMVARHLQIDVGRITHVQGDTDAVSQGKGSGGSSGLVTGGSAVWTVTQDLIAQGRILAADMLDCTPDALEFRDGGFFRATSNQTVTLADIAQTQPGGQWQVEARFQPPAPTFPNGTHICELTVDPETGAVCVLRYVGVEDLGRVLQPVLVEGQLQGGVAQGLSLGLGEEMVYDETGQLLTGTLMDYPVVRARDLPAFRFDTVEVPTLLNPLGVKGVGEAGTVGATAAFVSALGDALWSSGVQDLPMPATPHRVWAALQTAITGRVS